MYKISVFCLMFANIDYTNSIMISNQVIRTLFKLILVLFSLRLTKQVYMYMLGTIILCTQAN